MARPSAKTLAEVLAEHARATPNRLALIRDERTLSYGELLAQTVQAAKALLASGVKRGESVGVLLGNEPEWVVMALASSMIGARFCPLNTWYKKNEILWTMRHSGVRIVVSAARFLKTSYEDLFAELASEAVLGDAELVFVGATRAGATNWGAFLKRGDAISDADLASVRASVSPDTTAFVLYTSGSTADPKGVLLNHRGVVENGYDMGVRRGINGDDRVWIGSPLFYGLGATNALPAALTHGAAIVLQGHFEAGSAIESIRRSQASVYYGTGNMTRGMLDHPDYTRSKIGSLQKGNAGTVAEYKRLTLVEMGIKGAVPAYGLTETYGNATVGDMDDPIELKVAANGAPLPGMEMIIVDPATGALLPKGETGLVLIRGHTTPGYLNSPEETAKALRPDGFFDTGDLGSFNSDGHFIFNSRLKEVIKSGGINVSPVEVEQLLASHPDVRDAYVVGVGDPVKGELVVAFVDTAAPVSERALREYVKERAASFKAPHHVLFRSEAQLPRLASGKVSKAKLSEEARRELGIAS
jgi:fatty-acyl-CoA synthase